MSEGLILYGEVKIQSFYLLSCSSAEDGLIAIKKNRPEDGFSCYDYRL